MFRESCGSFKSNPAFVLHLRSQTKAYQQDELPLDPREILKDGNGSPAQNPSQSAAWPKPAWLTALALAGLPLAFGKFGGSESMYLSFFLCLIWAAQRRICVENLSTEISVRFHPCHGGHGHTHTHNHRNTGTSVPRESLNPVQGWPSSSCCAPTIRAPLTLPGCLHARPVPVASTGPMPEPPLLTAR
eukprot:COSAG01_NODE_8279_length_2846_cov_14.163087_3_plen_188_part_00